MEDERHARTPSLTSSLRDSTELSRPLLASEFVSFDHADEPAARDERKQRRNTFFMIGLCAVVLLGCATIAVFFTSTKEDGMSVDAVGPWAPYSFTSAQIFDYYPDHTSAEYLYSVTESKDLDVNVNLVEFNLKTLDIARKIRLDEFTTEGTSIARAMDAYDSTKDSFYVTRGSKAEKYENGCSVYEVRFSQGNVQPKWCLEHEEIELRKDVGYQYAGSASFVNQESRVMYFFEEYGDGVVQVSYTPYQYGDTETLVKRVNLSKHIPKREDDLAGAKPNHDIVGAIAHSFYGAVYATTRSGWLVTLSGLGQDFGITDVKDIGFVDQYSFLSLSLRPRDGMLFGLRQDSDGLYIQELKSDKISLDLGEYRRCDGCDMHLPHLSPHDNFLFLVTKKSSQMMNKKGKDKWLHTEQDAGKYVVMKIAIRDSSLEKKQEVALPGADRPGSGFDPYPKVSVLSYVGSTPFIYVIMEVAGTDSHGQDHPQSRLIRVSLGQIHLEGAYDSIPWRRVDPTSPQDVSGVSIHGHSKVHASKAVSRSSSIKEKFFGVRCCDSNDPEQIHLSLTENENEMAVSWVTPNEENGKVSYWITSENGKETTIDAERSTYDVASWRGYIYTAVMTNLKPETEYTYYVTGSRRNFPAHREFTFTTEADSPKNTTIGVIGDMGIENDQDTISALENLVQKKEISLVLHPGDIAYEDGDDPDSMHKWDTYMRSVEKFAAYAPYMVVPGNHEVRHNYTAYKERFRMPRTFDEDPDNGETNYFYSFTYGYATYIGFSSEHDFRPGSVQYRFLDEALSIADGNRDRHPWVVLFFHRALYCSNRGGDSDYDCAGMAEKFRIYIENNLIRKYKVDLVLNAHIHAYERIFPTENGVPSRNLDDPKRPVYVVNGAAGCQEGLDGGWPSPMPDWSAFHMSTYGYATMHVSKHAIAWKFFAFGANKIVDEFTLTKPS